MRPSNSRTPSPPQWLACDPPLTYPPPQPGLDPQTALMLGRLIQTAEHTAYEVHGLRQEVRDEFADVRARLSTGDELFRAHAQTLAEHGRRLDQGESARAATATAPVPMPSTSSSASLTDAHISRIERLILRHFAWLIPLGIAVHTGKTDLVLDALRALPVLKP